MAQPLPDAVILLLTNPRSGSTWLFDALRTHPAVGMLPRATLFRRLALRGRRYPRDLSDPDGTWGERVEVRPRCWETIPVFDAPGAGELAGAGAMTGLRAIEKFHPFFYSHDTGRFLNRLERLEKRIGVHLVYQVRDPATSMLSFVNYQERNPDWNPEITRDELPGWTARIYESIAECRRLRPGPVIEYRQLVEDFTGTLAGLFAHFWPDRTAGEREGDAALAALLADATEREKRDRGQGTFLGQETGPARADDELLGRHFGTSDEVERCRRAWRSLVGEEAETGRRSRPGNGAGP
jgi:hypothetical protein